MELFTNQVLAGIATGAIYACMALAVVMIYQAIDHLNFAQGEMAMFSTFMSWQMMQWGVPYWGAFILTLALYLVASGYDFQSAIYDKAGQPLVKARKDPEVIVTEVDLNERLLWPWLGDWRARIWREGPRGSEN